MQKALDSIPSTERKGGRKKRTNFFFFIILVGENILTFLTFPQGGVFSGT
jgi:hypothetical protein